MEQAALGAVWVAAGLALAVVVAQWAAQFAETRMTGRTGERVLYALRVKIFAQLQRLGLDYYERELTGKIMTRMTTDVDALSTFLQTGLVTAVVSVFTFFGILIALLVLDVELALIVFATLPLLVVGTIVFRRKSVAAYELARDRVSLVNADLQESVAGLRIVQAFRRERSGAVRFAERSDSYRAARVRGQWLISVYFPFVQLLSSGAAAAVLIVGAGRVEAGTLTTGALVAYLLYIDLFFAPVQQLSQVFDGYQQATVSLGRIQGLLREPTTTPRPADPVEVRELRGEIAFEDVRFQYGTAEERGGKGEALAGISLRIPAGQTVAFVGETGAGKSTLVKMVARFYDPTSGRITADGTDLRELDLTGYRHRLGVVPQEPYLFAGTVRDAIAYGRHEASDAEVEAAARAVGAHDMIATLDGGYLHTVAERGRNLSAGQRQLIALARAELVDPDVLLLDEATAALDLATEAQVNQATDRLAGKRTTLVVAHRLTTAARADRVVVMDRGRVVEDGSHTELLARGGVTPSCGAPSSGRTSPPRPDGPEHPPRGSDLAEEQVPRGVRVGARVVLADGIEELVHGQRAVPVLVDPPEQLLGVPGPEFRVEDGLGLVELHVADDTVPVGVDHRQERLHHRPEGTVVGGPALPVQPGHAHRVLRGRDLAVPVPVQLGEQVLPEVGDRVHQRLRLGRVVGLAEGRQQPGAECDDVGGVDHAAPVGVELVEGALQLAVEQIGRRHGGAFRCYGR